MGRGVYEKGAYLALGKIVIVIQYPTVGMSTKSLDSIPRKHFGLCLSAQLNSKSTDQVDDWSCCGCETVFVLFQNNKLAGAG